LTERRVLLIRHARSAHIHAGWIDSRGFRGWREKYESAGIDASAHAPAGLVQLAANADLLLSSDALRAIATARLLAPGREPVTSPLLRELDLEAPDFGSVRLPLLGWAVAVGARGLFGRGRDVEARDAEERRIHDAATWIDELSRQHPVMMVVTHASFRQRLAVQMRVRGWKDVPGRRRMRHWSAWVLSRSAPSR
jgi:broad specificity phosphatase PhoE